MCCSRFRFGKGEVVRKKAVRGRSAKLKRYETYRNPKYSKAVRGRTALQMMSNPGNGFPH